MAYSSQGSHTGKLDFCILSINLVKLIEELNLIIMISTVSREIGLTMNTSKTKIMTNANVIPNHVRGEQST